MVIIRLISLLLLALALMTLGADAVTSLEQGDGGFVVRSLGDVLGLVNASPVDWIESTLPDSVAGALLMAFSWPAWGVVGVIGVLLALVAGRGGDD